ncbi:alkyl hydroperoxide reductase/ Thiol specific antioxidant/ Mal allergen [Geobacter metallireducens RCH3]|uniref:Thioredoxin-related protein disulfide reductase, putative n=1 Tax=Geobacter metallireducens (strain ATCC 53774 / DSM 7210 / GS-15) TaxID=269799 RepID=Q39QN2_GEOMG|nr:MULTISPECIES: TlpA disulfide reductase family protein [Geobacter]ABB33442.1 thioredoxin-related protein disulfide reductase, putative [Geobacter metallireducens GS-15]EHP87495.1 alkyl hydroperoxide reductase/ Thiol specific antioxidant/ Mal allergen [Geobacter metallireducens RCH3]MBT1074731.1 TlpA family protein disulfide reductase [Geobacter grbiciae]
MRIVPVLRAFVAAAGFTMAVASPSLAIPQKGQPAPPLKVVSTSGQQISLANYKGYVLVIDFFATWCPPCREAIPHLNGISRKYGRQGLQVLGLSLDDGDEGAVKDFIASKRIVYPVALAGQDVQTDYGLRSLPTVYVIDKRGNVADRFMGGSDATLKNMETLIKKLLAEK